MMCDVVQIPLFEGISESFLRYLSCQVQMGWFLSGDVISEMNMAGRKVYYIHRGEVGGVNSAFDES